MSRLFEQNIALDIANTCIGKLKPHCVLINLAGSLRRNASQVHDIEIVLLPRRKVVSTNLFGDYLLDVSPDFIQKVNRLGTILKGEASGRYCKVELAEGIAVDIFMPQVHDYYRQFAIRTGSAEFSHTTIAAAWVRKGWVGTADGLRKRSECVQTPSGYKCEQLNPEKPPVWNSEEQFFAWLGLKWVEPEKRIY